MYSLKLERIIKTEDFGDVVVTIAYDNQGPKVINVEGLHFKEETTKQLETFLSIVNFALISGISPKKLSKKLDSSSKIANLEINKLIGVIAMALAEAPGKAENINSEILMRIKGEDEVSKMPSELIEEIKEEENEEQMEVVQMPQESFEPPVISAPKPKPTVVPQSPKPKLVPEMVKEQPLVEEPVQTIQMDLPKPTPKIVEKNEPTAENAGQKHHSFFKNFNITKPKIEEPLIDEEEGVLNVQQIEDSAMDEIDEEQQAPATKSMPPRIMEEDAYSADEVVEEEEKPKKFFNPFKRSE